MADILFLQKRESPGIANAEWTKLGKSAEGFTINQYFAEHPEMVLGTLTEESTQYGKMECTVKPIEGADLAEQLKEAISHIHGTIEAVQVQDTDLEDEVVTIPADPKVKNFTYTVVDGEVYYRENSVMSRMNLPAATAERVKGMVAIRDCAQELIDCQTNDGSEEQIAELQLRLNTLYDAYTKKYGLLSSSANKRAFNQDKQDAIKAAFQEWIFKDPKKDDVVTFEQLGVDRLFVDESHGFKNLFLYTKMRNIAGIAQTEAQKSSDMFAKCRYMDELTGSRGVTTRKISEVIR